MPDDLPLSPFGVYATRVCDEIPKRTPKLFDRVPFDPNQQHGVLTFVTKNMFLVMVISDATVDEDDRNCEGLRAELRSVREQARKAVAEEKSRKEPADA